MQKMYVVVIDHTPVMSTNLGICSSFSKAQKAIQASAIPERCRIETYVVDFLLDSGKHL